MTFHLNSKGEPGRCKAQPGNCPFGDETAHYGTKEQARLAYEATMESNNQPEKPFDNLEDSVVKARAVGDFTRLSALKQGLSDEEYELRREYIRRINRSEDSTHRQHSKRLRGKTVYSEERAAQQDAIVDTILARYSHVPSGGRAILSGGMPGAGKTTLLRSLEDIRLDEWATVNPDDVKLLMAEKAMTPAIEGLLPLETDELIKYEAQLITARIYDRVLADRRNLIVDRTMVRSAPVEKELKRLREQGYTSLEVVFADVAPDTAYGRIRQRHKDGVDRFLKTGEGLGERVTPGSAVAISRSEDEAYRSVNGRVLVELTEAGYFTSEPRIFDTTDGVRPLTYQDFKA